MNRPGLRVACLWIGLCCVSVSATAHADSCFSLPDVRSESSKSSARKITLGTRVVTSAACEYALAADASWVTLHALDSDFAGIVDALSRESRSSLTERPTTIYARTRAQGAAGSRGGVGNGQLESIFLAACTETLLSEAHGFSLRVPVDTQRPTITRVTDTASCGAAQISLVAVALPATTAAPLLTRGPFNERLTHAATELVLAPGSYAIYGLRTDDGVGYLLGRVATESSLTPLRQALDAAAEGQSEPWLRAQWTQGRMQLTAISDALRQSEAWSELRTVAASDHAWLQRPSKRRGERSGGQPLKLGKVVFDAAGSAILLPADDAARDMSERYGDAGRAMTPDLHEWRSMIDDMELCVAKRYALPHHDRAAATAEVSAQCVAMARLLAPMTLQGGMDLGAGRVCVRDNLRIMAVSAAHAGQGLPETCVDLQRESDVATSAPVMPLVNTGSQLRYEGRRSQPLFACVNNQCQPLPEGDATLALQQQGLLEVRQADSLAHATSSQALTRARIGVINPDRQWHPVGVHTADAQHPDGPWHTLLHDTDHVFTYARRRQRVDFRLTVTPTLAAAWNQRASANTQLTQDLPMLGGVEGTLEGAKHAALVTLITRGAACPEASAGEVAAQPAIDPEQLLPDQDFYVHLAHYIAPDQALRCMARAHFRVVDSRSLRATDQIRVGLLGDVQLMLFITRPAAIGLSLPLIYGFWRWGYGFGLDGSISLSSAITFDPSQISRTGLMASAALWWGPDAIAPRLLSFGVALHAATGTHDDAPFGSVYAGLNLSSLLDLAGGR